MKRLTLVLVAGLVLAACIPAQSIDTLHIGPTGTVTWNPRSEWLSVELFPSDALTYTVFAGEWGVVTDWQNVAQLTELGSVPVELYALNIDSLPGQTYAIGVQARVDRDGMVSVSDIAWSFDGDVATGAAGRWLIAQDGTIQIDRVTGLTIGD